MIKFQDCKKDKKTSGDGEIDCVRKMNEWIENKNIQVISVETLTEVTGDGFSTDTCFIMLRLWYKEVC
ncbi:TPA: hypothetical protein MAI69_004986 [Klebsiella pneumoniae]|nr:hypothetical protein [Klebsiella pneumoniae]